MTLEEQLAMATSTVAETVQPTPVAQPVVEPVQTTVTTAPITQPIPQVVPVQPTMTTPVMPAAPTQPIQAAPQISTENGVQTIQLGQIVNTNKINLLRKLNIGDRVRFSLLNTTDISFIEMHYSEDMGKFACFSTDQQLGQCCKDLGKPKARYTMPILVYPTMPQDTNTVIPGAHAELRVLSIWDAATYDFIAQEVISANGAPIDFIATGADNFGRLSVRSDRNSFMPNFTTDFQAATQTWSQYKDTVPTLVRKNMDANTYNHIKAQAANSNNYNNTYPNYNGNYNGIM